ncbi:hypothetical protein, partial [Acinetobacter baumannii]|uniref:hypothetical protein n=1 Tax=Acinetobacter baumannii TaxID=470 RepID=UPI00339B3201
VCYLRAKMTCHADIIRPRVLPNGYDGIPRSTSLDRVCFQRAMRACHALRGQIMFAIQGR